MNYSSVDFVKEVARFAGWNGEKNLHTRKFLSDLKDLLTFLDDIPFKKIEERMRAFYNMEEQEDSVTLMTLHSAKGLDFDNVFIPYANTSMYISPNDSLAKTLFMVAMTRTRENLYITYNGYPSDYLDAFKSNCSLIDISSTAAQTSRTNNTWGF